MTPDLTSPKVPKSLHVPALAAKTLAAVSGALIAFRDLLPSWAVTVDVVHIRIAVINGVVRINAQLVPPVGLRT